MNLFDGFLESETMFNFVLTALPREERGKNANRRLRATGQIPAIVYGRAIDPMSVVVDPKEVFSILHSESGRNTVFKLKINDKQMDVLIRELQVDPIRGHLLHADFQTISMDETRAFKVPIDPVGEAEGVKGGGILDIVVREIEVECLPKDVPDHIPVDISDLEVGEAIRVRDLEITAEGIEVLSDPNLVLLTVVPPKVEVEPEAEELEDEEEAAEEVEGAPETAEKTPEEKE